MQIKGYYPESKDFAFTTKVISLELLMLLKLIPVGREKDLIDVFALLIDKGKEANLNKISKKCKQCTPKNYSFP